MPGKAQSSGRPSIQVPAIEAEANELQAFDNGEQLDMENVREHHGYILDASRYRTNGSRLKTATDDRTVRIPQPSDDSNDLLNWPQRKKNMTLFVITCISFLSDYSSSQGIAVLVPQARYACPCACVMGILH